MPDQTNGLSRVGDQVQHVWLANLFLSWWLGTTKHTNFFDFLVSRFLSRRLLDSVQILAQHVVEVSAMGADYHCRVATCARKFKIICIHHMNAQSLHRRGKRKSCFVTLEVLQFNSRRPKNK